MKLSGAYMDTTIGPPTYADATQVAQAFVKAAPERMVWGSDWPHPTEKDKPDDAILFDLLAEWVPDEATRNRILVQNPARFTGSGKLRRRRGRGGCSRRRRLRAPPPAGVRVLSRGVAGGGGVRAERYSAPNCRISADHRRQNSGVSSSAVWTMTSFEAGSTQTRWP